MVKFSTLFFNLHSIWLNLVLLKSVLLVYNIKLMLFTTRFLYFAKYYKADNVYSDQWFLISSILRHNIGLFKFSRLTHHKEFDSNY